MDTASVAVVLFWISCDRVGGLVYLVVTLCFISVFLVLVHYSVLSITSYAYG